MVHLSEQVSVRLPLGVVCRRQGWNANEFFKALQVLAIELLLHIVYYWLRIARSIRRPNHILLFLDGSGLRGFFLGGGLDDFLGRSFGSGFLSGGGSDTEHFGFC